MQVQVMDVVIRVVQEILEDLVVEVQVDIIHLYQEEVVIILL